MVNVQDVDPPAAAIRVDSMIDAVFSGVNVLSRLAAELHEGAAGAQRQPTTVDLAAIRPTVFEHLADDGPLAGTGVIAAPGVLSDQPRWLEWWRRPPGSTELRPLSVDLDPHHISGYEYTSMPWFDTPRRTGHRVVVGPYVDYAGTDEYILTFACPVHSDAGFFGVAAADIRASDFEQMMLPLLDAAGQRSLLVNASGRVIASNTSEIIVGSLTPRISPASTEIQLGLEWQPCAGLPWSLVTW